MLLFGLDIGIKLLLFMLNIKKTLTNKPKRIALEKDDEKVSSAHLLSLVNDFNN